MPHPDLTEILIVLDRSGSMATTRTDMEGGFDAFIQAQRRLPGECRVTLVQFDDVVEIVYEGVSLARVPPLTLEPRGSTALYDGIGFAIDGLSRRLAVTPDAQRPSRVLAVIITDGGENASRTYTRDRLLARIEKKRLVDRWELVYLGANQDAFAVGNAIGIQHAYGYQATPAGTARLMEGVSASAASYRAGTGYTPPCPPPRGRGGGGSNVN
jgi:uncharacterized protein YegL